MSPVSRVPLSDRTNANPESGPAPGSAESTKHDLETFEESHTLHPEMSEADTKLWRKKFSKYHQATRPKGVGFVQRKLSTMTEWHSYRKCKFEELTVSGQKRPNIDHTDEFPNKKANTLIRQSPANTAPPQMQPQDPPSHPCMPEGDPTTGDLAPSNFDTIDAEPSSHQPVFNWLPHSNSHIDPDPTNLDFIESSDLNQHLYPSHYQSELNEMHATFNSGDITNEFCTPNQSTPSHHRADLDGVYTTLDSEDITNKFNAPNQSAPMSEPFIKIQDQLQPLEASDIQVFNGVRFISPIPNLYDRNKTFNTDVVRSKRHSVWNIPKGREPVNQVISMWTQVLDPQLPFFKQALNVQPLVSYECTISIIEDIHVLFGYEAEFSANGELLPISSLEEARMPDNGAQVKIRSKQLRQNGVQHQRMCNRCKTKRDTQSRSGYAGTYFGDQLRICYHHISNSSPDYMNFFLFRPLCLECIRKFLERFLASFLKPILFHFTVCNHIVEPEAMNIYLWMLVGLSPASELWDLCHECKQSISMELGDIGDRPICPHEADEQTATSTSTPSKIVSVKRILRDIRLPRADMTLRYRWSIIGTTQLTYPLSTLLDQNVVDEGAIDQDVVVDEGLVDNRLVTDDIPSMYLPNVDSPSAATVLVQIDGESDDIKQLLDYFRAEDGHHYRPCNYSVKEAEKNLRHQLTTLMVVLDIASTSIQPTILNTIVKPLGFAIGLSAISKLEFALRIGFRYKCSCCNVLCSILAMQAHQLFHPNKGFFAENCSFYRTSIDEYVQQEAKQLSGDLASYNEWQCASKITSANDLPDANQLLDLHPSLGKIMLSYSDQLLNSKMIVNASQSTAPGISTVVIGCCRSSSWLKSYHPTKFRNDFYTTAIVLEAAVRQLGVTPDLRTVHMLYNETSLDLGGLTSTRWSRPHRHLVTMLQTLASGSNVTLVILGLDGSTLIKQHWKHLNDRCVKLGITLSLMFWVSPHFYGPWLIADFVTSEETLDSSHQLNLISLRMRRLAALRSVTKHAKVSTLRNMI